MLAVQDCVLHIKGDTTVDEDCSVWCLLGKSCGIQLTRASMYDLTDGFSIIVNISFVLSRKVLLLGPKKRV